MMNDSNDDGTKRLFFTTSDLMNKINENLAELESPNDTISPRVELQKRLPDGSTQRADEKELAAADMQTKFKQAAEQVARLDSPEEKIAWAKHQRQEGNKLYATGDYRAAMDVYLTCLVTKTDNEEFLTQVFLPTLNNLALCSLKLSMWSKTDEFCTLAIKEYKKDSTLLENAEAKDDATDTLAKIYFRRGKSRRLRGMYKDSRSDLEQAMMLLDEEALQERQLVEREIALVNRAEIEGQKNEDRQKRAMRHFLGSSADNAEAQPIYPEHTRRRKYSTLRSKKSESVDKPTGQFQEARAELSCWDRFLLIVAALAEKALKIIGDDETPERIAQGEMKHHDE